VLGPFPKASTPLTKILSPPRSGRTIEIPEADRAAWFSLNEARERILKSQQPFLDTLHDRLSTR
jgi:predicted NUDIX family NTP pyrophosphohydrolase